MQRTITVRALQLYVFLLPLEFSLSALFGVDTVWKPYRVSAILVAIVAIAELPCKKLDRYDKSFLGMFLTACGLSLLWCLFGRVQPLFVLNAFLFVLIPFAMYFCTKLSVTSSEELKGLIQAYVMGALVDACYVTYQALVRGQTERPAGLSGEAPENLALHCGLALAFILCPYGDRRPTWFSRALRLCAGSVLCFAVMVSGTRAAWIGLTLSTIVIGCVMATTRSQSKRLLRLLIPAVLVAIGVVIFHGGDRLKTGDGDLVKNVAERLQTSELKTGTGRTEIWHHALDVMASYYGLGGGFSGFMQGTYRLRKTFYLFTPISIENGIGSHNVFLEVLIDYGPISLLLFLGCISALLRVLFRRAMDSNRDLSSHGMLYAFLFLMVCGCCRDLTGNPDFWAIMAFLTVFVRPQSFQVHPQNGDRVDEQLRDGTDPMLNCA